MYKEDRSWWLWWWLLVSHSFISYHTSNNHLPRIILLFFAFLPSSDMATLKGKTAIVTGSGKLNGIGAATAIALAEQGANVS